MDLRQIIADLRGERDRLQSAIDALESIGGSGRGTVRNTTKRSSKVTAINRERHLSAAARRRISQAQKRRWAERKKAA